MEVPLTRADVETLLHGAARLEPDFGPPAGLAASALARWDARRMRARTLQLSLAATLLITAALGSIFFRREPRAPLAGAGAPSVRIARDLRVDTPGPAGRHALTQKPGGARTVKQKPKFAPRSGIRKQSRKKPRLYIARSSRLPRARWTVETIHRYETEFVVPALLEQADPESGQVALQPALLRVPVEIGEAVTSASRHRIGHASIRQEEFE